MRILGWLVIGVLLSTSVFAKDSFEGTVEKIDAKTVKIVSAQETTYDISELVAKRDYLVSEKAQSDNSFDNRIAALDARIQEAKALGVE